MNSSKELLEIIGANLKAFRLARNQQIETVAKAMEISPELLDRIEKGEYDMDLLLLLNLCEHYGVVPKSVFKDPPL